jgi:hypothetical protein
MYFRRTGETVEPIAFETVQQEYASKCDGKPSKPPIPTVGERRAEKADVAELVEPAPPPPTVEPTPRGHAPSIRPQRKRKALEVRDE